MSDHTAVAQQFCEYYYRQFDTDRTQLNVLYRQNSQLTFEGHTVVGISDVIEKLVGLPFQRVAHRVSTLDAQPFPDNSIMVMVTGELLIDDESNPQRFSQSFHLVPEGQSYFVSHDIFRLNYS